MHSGVVLLFTVMAAVLASACLTALVVAGYKLAQISGLLQEETTESNVYAKKPTYKEVSPLEPLSPIDTQASQHTTSAEDFLTARTSSPPAKEEDGSALLAKEEKEGKEESSRD